MIDFLIVGQGIAGTILSYLLTDSGYRVKVVDDNQPSSSSRVAAGIYNPVTGRVMKKTWMADKLFSVLTPFYTRMEETLGKQILHELPIYRPFVSMEEQNDWVGRSASGDYDAFVREVVTASRFSAFLHDPFGGLLLNNCGYLDIPVMLDAWRQYLVAQEAYVQERFDESKLELAGDGVRYGEIHAAKVVYCMGGAAANTALFSWLPFRPVKGEVLTIEAEADRSAIYNRGVFLLPRKDGKWRLGATYNWQNLDSEPTEEAKAELLERLQQLFKKNVIVREHVAGVRPATKDRRPFLGVHPGHENVYIFNGLGTKGVSLAPYFGQQMAAFLTKNDELMPEVNISRYYSLYFH